MSWIFSSINWSNVNRPSYSAFFLTIFLFLNTCFCLFESCYHGFLFDALGVLSIEFKVNSSFFVGYGGAYCVYADCAVGLFYYTTIFSLANDMFDVTIGMFSSSSIDGAYILNSSIAFFNLSSIFSIAIGWQFTAARISSLVRLNLSFGNTF